MIKVLIVDDDRLVRKGLSSSMPWERFDMQVVGEASNGKKALEFLKENSVDLLLTDIAMPVMSGIELMRLAHMVHPELFIVVLTFHEDFEYIQETLRLGAIDYISKLQLERENFDDVLERIHQRVLKEQSKKKTENIGESIEKPFTAGFGYFILSNAESFDIVSVKRHLSSSCQICAEIDSNSLFYVPQYNLPKDTVQELILRVNSFITKGIILLIDGINGKMPNDVMSKLKKYSQRDFFYDFEVENKVVLKSIDEIGIYPVDVSNEEFSRIRKHWLAFEWIYNNKQFDKLLFELQKIRLPEIRLVHLMYEIAREWEKIYKSITTDGISLPDTITCWCEAMNWLANIRESALNTTQQYPYSEEIIGSIMGALKIVEEEMDQEVYAQVIAKRVNMSRSYFNQVFKDVMGKSFNDYLKYVRVEKAKEFLVKSNKSIQVIAELVGYMNQKYFSQVFKEQTGMLPSEYRQKYSKV